MENGPYGQLESLYRCHRRNEAITHTLHFAKKSRMCEFTARAIERLRNNVTAVITMDVQICIMLLDGDFLTTLDLAYERFFGRLYSLVRMSQEDLYKVEIVFWSKCDTDKATEWEKPHFHIFTHIVVVFRSYHQQWQ